MIEALPAEYLPASVEAGFVAGVNGLRVHVLEAGRCNDKLVVLLHGFPELAFSWRKVMPALAEAGYHVLAPDLRGYGRTTGWDAGFDIDVGDFSMLNLVRDLLALVFGVGRQQVAMVAGHDVGAGIAAACALVRPDVFRSVALLGAPFAGPPALPFVRRDQPAAPAAGVDMAAALAGLDPPRRHYHDYYSTPAADAEMRACPQGVHDFLRAYYHHKSADWPGNQPAPLAEWSAEALAVLPTYYVMPRDETMAQTVAHEMPTQAQIAACGWLTDDELRVYSGEYQRTGFQGGLNWYRGRTGGLHSRQMSTFAGMTIDVPACFIAGRNDWGVFQKPGDYERMQAGACSRLRFCELIEGAGHWVQQECPDAVTGLLLGFLRNQG